MNKELVKRLTTIAEGLPPVFELKQTPISAEEAKKHYKNADPKRQYYMRTQQPVNHLNKLKAAWKQGKEDGVSKYCSQAHLTSATQAKLKPKEVNTL